MLNGKTIIYGITASMHKVDEAVEQIESLTKVGINVHPALSYTLTKNDELVERLERLTGNDVISTMDKAEPFGPKNDTDLMIISPMTGNTMSKLSNAITDSALLMLAKSTLRNGKPLVLGISTNDALGLNGENLMKLISHKNIFFIPFGQDDPTGKPNSLVCDMKKLIPTLQFAFRKKQVQPMLLRISNKEGD